MDVFEALADETRRRILMTLAERPRTAGALVASDSPSRPAVSRHLRVLREAALVRADLVGRTRVYSLDAAALGPVRTLLAVLDRAAEADAAGAEAASSDSAALRHPAPPIAPERLDALDLEVRRTGREREARRREDIA